MLIFECKQASGSIRASIKIGFMLLLVFVVTVSRADSDLSDEEIAAVLIQESIRNYSGSCPCPYNLMKNGKRCGGHSAYSKPGGKSPLCYRDDVTEELIEEWKVVH